MTGTIVIAAIVGACVAAWAYFASLSLLRAEGKALRQDIAEAKARLAALEAVEVPKVERRHLAPIDRSPKTLQRRPH